MKNWFRKRISERSTKFAAMLVIAVAGVAGFELTVEQQAQIQQLIMVGFALVMSLTPDKRPADDE
jgi:hypothetical protein